MAFFNARRNQRKVWMQDIIALGLDTFCFGTIDDHKDFRIEDRNLTGT